MVVGHSFDLGAQIPLQARLLRMGEDEHVLVAVAHHIAADGWSMGPLVRDLGVAYASRCAGNAPGWAIWWCSTSTTRCGSVRGSGTSRIPRVRSRRSWGTGRTPWPGLPERVELPTDRPYPLVADYAGARVGFEWPAGLQEQIIGLARTHHATSFMVVQAALAVLLTQLGAGSDVAVGFPIAGRGDQALDELVGFFVNTLVLRVQVVGDPSVAEVFAQVRERSLAAYDHQDVPFEVLVERLNPARSLAHHPLVQVMLAWQNLTGHTGGPTDLSLGGVRVSPLSTETHTARMDLTLSFEE